MSSDSSPSSSISGGLTDLNSDPKLIGKRFDMLTLNEPAELERNHPGNRNGIADGSLNPERNSNVAEDDDRLLVEDQENFGEEGLPSPSSSGYAGGRGSSSGTSPSRIGEAVEINDNEIQELRNDSSLGGISDSHASSWVSGKRHVDEDVASISWRKRKKHFFILSNSGKPIYSRYGDEHKLAGFSATLQAIISFVENGGDSVKLVKAGKHQVVFLVKGPIYLVCISCKDEPFESLRGQLELIYGQLILILTKSINRCFEKNSKFDMTPLLGGTDVIFSSLIHLFGWNPATFLHAYTCLPLAYGTRQAAGAILQDVADSGVLFAILMCKHKVISLVGAQKASLHPDDMLLLSNFVFSSESFRTSESFLPVCLPSYNPMAFLYAYVHFLDVNTYLMLLTTSSDAFYHLKESRLTVKALGVLANCSTLNRPPIPLYSWTFSLSRFQSPGNFVQSQSSIATGSLLKNKKQAEKNAAMAAWTSLKQLAKETASSSEPENNDELEQIIIARALLNYRVKEKMANRNSFSALIPFTKHKVVPRSQLMSATPDGCHHCKYKHLKATLFVKQLLMSPSGNSGHLAMGHGNAPPVTITAVPVFYAPPLQTTFICSIPSTTSIATCKFLLNNHYLYSEPKCR
ncbi:hypothetical protein GQ457_07G034370 [Hibiscus cannabinus]